MSVDDGGLQPVERDIQNWSQSTGVPDKVLRSIPALVVLLGVSGLPAFGAAVFCAIVGSEVGMKKMREFQRTVETELGLIESRTAQVEEAMNDNARVRDRLVAEVRALEDQLSSSQIQDIGILFEDYMQTLDRERLELLAGALRGVVAGSVDGDRRRTVLAGLRTLGASHIQRLAEIRKEIDERGYRFSGSLTPSGDSSIEWALVGVGFLRERIEVTGGGGGRRATVPASNVVKMAMFEVTGVGKDALTLLEGVSPGAP